MQPTYDFSQSQFGAGLQGDEVQVQDFYQNTDSYQDPYQSFLGGMLDLPLSSNVYNLQQNALDVSPQTLQDFAMQQFPNRPALSASSGSAGSVTSSILGSPAISEHRPANTTVALEHCSLPSDMSYTSIDASGIDAYMNGNINSNFLASSLFSPLPLVPVGNSFYQYLPRHHTHPASPALSTGSIRGPTRTSHSHTKASRGNSPYQPTSAWAPYPQDRSIRRTSSHSMGHSSPSSAHEHDELDREKNRCPFPDCGKIFKDLKAHMLTHQNERPEKCPIPSCEYNKKGFSRKYDKNRHTLTHYKGTMVCGFCPGSGSAVEKSFNRADVFKRHLMSVHGVEQNPPNSRKRPAPPASKSAVGANDANGKCSICNGIFSTPQSFYEHLEDCVLSVVQNIEPSEAINEQLLNGIADDDCVRETMERHHLSTTFDASFAHNVGGDDDDEEHDSDDLEERTGEDDKSKSL